MAAFVFGSHIIAQEEGQAGSQLDLSEKAETQEMREKEDGTQVL